MTRYVLSPCAQRDIDEIWDYRATNWGAEQAEIYVRQIRRAVEIAGEDPLRGRACDDIRAGYRKYPAGSHFVFYRIVEGAVDVARILHQRMDFEQHLCRALPLVGARTSKRYCDGRTGRSGRVLA